ncbi:cytochrome P450 [Mycena rosella]|uniref:Cytochrome P450 n=1 Tax=Mycena rosella TaxID=1033263 RepID=A0AAD7D1K5_MYCRO|nr:cytochrome P450 [Mycena rosella]
MSLTLYSLAAFSGVVALFWCVVLPKRSRAAMLPPGPPGDPVIGNLRYMPTDQSAEVFHEWSKKYGDVMYLEVLGRRIVILDTHQAAVDLLEKRSSNYSDRPVFTLYELLGWSPSLPFLQYGKQWSKHRQMHHTYLNRHKMDDFKTMQTQEARTMVHNLMDCAPDKYDSYMGRFATGIISQIVAGHRITSDDDWYLQASKMVSEAMTRTGPPGSSPIDFFPALQYVPSWFPGAKHMGVVQKRRPTLRELHDYPVRTVREQKNLGNAKPSFILAQLEEMGDETDDYELKGAAATMFGAGESTTWSTVAVFILAMILYPEYQVKAQKEIDSVVGDLRLPGFEDRANLPLVDAILQEILRWNPPLGLPHRATEDDIYRGMLIPKGSLIIANIKAMSLNESVYSQPTSFYPERFLPKPVGNEEPPFINLAFGFGRRICTGRYLAENSVWIAIATILASCTISNAVDEHGEIIVPENRMSDGLVSHPVDIRCVISPRSSTAKALILEGSS